MRYANQLSWLALAPAQGNVILVGVGDGDGERLPWSGSANGIRVVPFERTEESAQYRIAAAATQLPELGTLAASAGL